MFKISFPNCEFQLLEIVIHLSLVGGVVIGGGKIVQFVLDKPDKLLVGISAVVSLAKCMMYRTKLICKFIGPITFVREHVRILRNPLLDQEILQSPQPNLHLSQAIPALVKQSA